MAIENPFSQFTSGPEKKSNMSSTTPTTIDNSSRSNGLVVASDGTFELPVVDFSPFLEPVGSEPTEGQLKAAKALDEACRVYGFVCLRNTGIPKTNLTSTFGASKALFQSDDETKNQLKKLDTKTNTGFSGFGSEALNHRRNADLKESFNVRNPFQEGYTGYQGTSSEFQSATGTLWKELSQLSKRFAKCCALALGLEVDYFSRTVEEMDLCTLRLIHYPPCPLDKSDAANPVSAIRVGEHTDFGIYTFLFVNDMHDKSSLGLQIKSIQGGDLGAGSTLQRDDEMFVSGWKDVAFSESFLKELDGDESASVLVNTGALMARWTNDVWRATAHRVIVTPEARNTSRYSIAGFIDPDAKTVCSVHEKFIPEGETAKYPPITSLDYLMMKLQESQGVKNEEKKSA